MHNGMHFLIPNIRNKASMLTLTTSIQHQTEGVSEIRKGKEIFKKYETGKEKVKVSLKC